MVTGVPAATDRVRCTMATAANVIATMMADEEAMIVATTRIMAVVVMIAVAADGVAMIVVAMIVAAMIAVAASGVITFTVITPNAPRLLIRATSSQDLRSGEVAAPAWHKTPANLVHDKKMTTVKRRASAIRPDRSRQATCA